ncbi:MAG: hypothetical protein GTO18_18605 [Anaerolineales bacterium]|nr:hypothetical protein [Anaerolineales bacterium]
MSKKPIKVIIAAAFSLLFLAFIVAFYYAPHKPFDASFFISLILSVRDLIIASAIIAVGGGLGFRILGRVHHNSIATLAIQAAFGVGLLSLLFLIIGIVGLYNSWVAWLTLVILLIILWRHILRWLSSWRGIWEGLCGASPFILILAGLCAFLVLYRLVEALAPPAKFDALVYHLWLPAEFAEAGKFFLTHENPYWGMPLSAEMIYTWAILLASAQAAAVVSWFLGIITLVGVLGLAGTNHYRAGWVGVAALLAGETISGSLGWAYSDWGAAMMGFGVIVALDAWNVQRRISGMLLAGLFAGFAFGFKYVAIIAVPTGLAMLLVLEHRKKFWRFALIFTAAASTVIFIWLLKNWAFAGAWLYPFVGETEWIETIRQEFFSGMEGSWPLLRILLLPVSATILGLEGGEGFSASIGPLLLGLMPGLLFVRRKRLKDIAGFAAFLFVGWLLWAAASFYNPLLGQSRLYYVLFPAWAILAAEGFEGLARVRLPGLRFGAVVGSMVVLSLSLSAITTLQEGLRYQPLAVVLGVESDAQYLTRRFGAYIPAMDTVQNLDESSVVLMLWEPRGYYCRGKCVADVWLDEWYVSRTMFGDGESILMNWMERDYSHLLIHESGMLFIRERDIRYSNQDWITLDHLLAELPLVETIGEGYELYEIIP